MQTLHPTLLTPPPAGFTTTWGTSFSAIHGPNARTAESNGLLDGLPLTGAASDPRVPMLRGEVAQVLWNVYRMTVPALENWGRGPKPAPPRTGGLRKTGNLRRASR